MRSDITEDMQTFLDDVPNTGIDSRTFVYIHAKNRDNGLPQPIGIWTGERAITVSVKSGITGTNESRTYVGGEAMDPPEITETSDLSIQTLSLTLNHISGLSQLLVREEDVRNCLIEIHMAASRPSSPVLVDQPILVYVGIIDRAPINTPAAGGEGSIQLICVTQNIAMLERLNHSKSSYEEMRDRDGDEWGLYSNSVESWTVPWGTKDVEGRR